MAVASTRKKGKPARSRGANDEARKAPRRDPKQGRSEETIRILLDATELTLIDVGLQGVTTGAIAARAGISVGTLFHYYPTKAAILAAWEERQIVRAGEIILGELLHMNETNPPLDYCIRRVVHLGCALHVDHLRMCGLFNDRSVENITVAGLSRLKPQLEMAARAAELLASALSLALDAHLLRPTNDRLLSMALSLETTIVMAYVGATKHPEQIASGAFQEELASLVCRYLMGDAADRTAREAYDPAANLPRLPSMGARRRATEG